MDLEADLGIDSIKRVEILAALQETRSRPRPGARSRDGRAQDARRDRGAPRTARESGSARLHRSPRRPGPRATSAACCSRSSRRRRAIPPRCCELEMDLEADLGIDSIKRVEILAALQDAPPTCPRSPRPRWPRSGRWHRSPSGWARTTARRRSPPRPHTSGPPRRRSRYVRVLGRFELASIPAPAIGLGAGGLVHEPAPCDHAGRSRRGGCPRRASSAARRRCERLRARPGARPRAWSFSVGSASSTTSTTRSVSIARAFEAAQAVAPRLAAEGGAVRHRAGHGRRLRPRRAQNRCGPGSAGSRGSSRQPLRSGPKPRSRRSTSSAAAARRSGLRRPSRTSCSSVGPSSRSACRGWSADDARESRRGLATPGPPLVDQGSMIVATGGGARRDGCRRARPGAQHALQSRPGSHGARRRAGGPARTSRTRSPQPSAARRRPRAEGRTLGPAELRSEARRVLAGVRSGRRWPRSETPVPRASICGVDVRDEASVRRPSTRFATAFGAHHGRRPRRGRARGQADRGEDTRAVRPRLRHQGRSACARCSRPRARIRSS